MAITYINGNGQDQAQTKQTFEYDLSLVGRLGSIIRSGPQYPLLRNTEESLITVPLGRIDKTSSDRGEIQDRAPNLPSGYNTLGVPTFGSGKQNLVDSPQTSGDYAYGKNAQFVYFWPSAPVATKFASRS